MTGPTLRALLAHWRRNPLQLVALLVGLALATGLWSGVQAVNAEARASYDAAAATLGEGRFAQILSADGRGIAVEEYVALRRGGWLVSPVVEGRFEGRRLVGLDALTVPGGLGPLDTETAIDDGILAGGALFGTAEALADLPETGLSLIEDPDVAPGTLLTDISVAGALLGTDRFSRLLVAPRQPIRQIPLEEIAPGLSLRPAQTGSDVGRLTDSFHLNLTAFGFLSFAVGLFIVHGAIGLAFEQRRPMIRTLRALGVPLATLVRLLAFELLALALVAGAVGVALGYLLAALLLPDVAATLRGLYGAEVAGTLGFRPEWWLSGLAIAIIGTAAAGGAALWKIARMPLLASGQPRAWAFRAGSGRRAQAGIAVGLLAIAGWLVVAGEGLAQGFIMLGALLVGAALLLPLILATVLALGAARARRPVAGWFWADTRQQLPGLSLALMALLLAMAANVGVSTMVSSFRLTFTGFLDQRLASEFYVSAEDPLQAARIRDEIGPDVEALLPIVWVDIEVAGVPSELYGQVAHRTYEDNWQFLSAAPTPWETLRAGTGAIVNEQLARRANLTIGTQIAVHPDVSLPIVGIYGDYGNPIGQVVIAFPLFADLYPEAEPTRYGVRVDPAEVPALRDRLAGIGVPEGNMVDQTGIKAFSLEVFERTFTVTGALNVLTLAVAGFAILMSLLTLASLRVPQLAPVWALGLNRRDLGRLELLRALVLAILTTLLALPLGLALAWVLLAVVNVEAFGWRLPLYLFPADYLRLSALTLVAAALAAAWPALRLSRTPPADLLKVFANER